MATLPEYGGAAAAGRTATGTAAPPAEAEAEQTGMTREQANAALAQLDEYERNINNIPTESMRAEARARVAQARARIQAGLQEAEADQRRDFYDDLASDFAAVPDDPATQARATELGDLRTREVDRGLFDAERGITAGYSRRGIGGSGYAASAQSQAVQAAAAERARSRASALDQAVSERQRGIMGEAQIAGRGDPFLMAMLTNAQSQENMALQYAWQQRAAAEAAKNEFDQYMLDLGMEAAGYGVGGMGAGGGVTNGGMGPGVSAPEYF